MRKFTLSEIIFDEVLWVTEHPHEHCIVARRSVLITSAVSGFSVLLLITVYMYISNVLMTPDLYFSKVMI